METLELKFVGELAVVKPQPGDVFVVSTDQCISSEIAKRIGEYASKALGAERVLCPWRRGSS